MSLFQKAEKSSAKARVALLGPSGSGKTFSALSIAQGLGDKIALIDTERGSASKYADLFAFDVLELASFAPERYIEAIQGAAAEGYDVLIIDSLSHAWSGKDGILEFVDQQKKRGAGGLSPWGEATPKQNALVNAMLSAPLHVITTLRVKMEYVQEKDDKGKTTIRKIGLQPVQRDGLEYEFDVVGDLNQANDLIISKTRCVALSGEIISRPGKALGEQLKAWLTGTGGPVRTAVEINGRTYRTAGVEKDALLSLWNLSAAYNKRFGKDAAKALMVEATQKDSSLNLTAAEGVTFIELLKTKLEAPVEEPTGDPAASAA